MKRFRKLNLAALAALIAAVTVQCGEGGVGPPPDAASIEMAGGNGQAAQVGTPLPSPLTVLVTDDAGDPVSGVTVQWSIGGGGDVSPASGATGSDGKASATRTLGATAGQQTTIAAVSGLQGSPVTFTATATEGGGGEGITITNNPPTAALTGEVFDPVAQPMVQVIGAGGQPAAGVEVTASVASGGGTLEGTTTATTDASGVAKFGDLGITGTGAQTLEFTAGTSSVTSAPVNLSPLTPEATTGEWGPLVNWDIVPLHMHLLPNGKLLAWGKFEPGGTVMGMPRLWDPASGPPTGAVEVPVDTMLFCSGHAFMPDGRLLISGGHKQDDKGIDVTNIFDWTSGSFVPGLPKMAFGRWYPTVTELTDGRMLTMAGRDSAGAVVTTPEIWENNQWVKLPGAGALQIPYYPRNFIDPKNSLVFMAGERIMSRWFDPDGSAAGGRGRWIDGPSHIWPFNRDYGTAAMYEPGKILVVGGGGNTNWLTPDAKSATPTATAEKIDLNAGTPTWQSAGSMSAPRRHLNSTILPDGQVLITGGTSGGGFVNINEGLAEKAAEEWNPSTNQWTTLASNTRMRVYHSVSILLPDATVLHGASGNAMAGAVPVPDENNHEIFSPPYLFKGVRPTITSPPPASVGYGQSFEIATPNAAQVTTVRWIHIGSVTHAFDFGQRANTLTFARTATGVSVTAPSGPNLAPRGHYILFILNRNGVPSTGQIIKLQ